MEVIMKPWPWYVSGPLIGLLVPLLLLGCLISPAMAQAPIDNIPTEGDLLMIYDNTLIARNYTSLKDRYEGTLPYCDTSSRF